MLEEIEQLQKQVEALWLALFKSDLLLCCAITCPQVPHKLAEIARSARVDNKLVLAITFSQGGSA